MRSKKLSQRVIRDFGDEWAKFTFLEEGELRNIEEQSKRYFNLIENEINTGSLGTVADFGAGTGRWSQFLLPKCLKLYLVEPSHGAFEVLKKRFSGDEKAIILNQRIEDSSLADNALDLGLCLGVLHHIPDTELALKSINRKLKPEGTLLAYMYYNLENRNVIYKLIFHVSALLRRVISLLPTVVKKRVCDLIALLVYFPLARLSKHLSQRGIETSNFPLHHYESLPFYVMRNDALDRFGTKLEKRYSRKEIIDLLEQTGFDTRTLIFSDAEPFWTFKVRKSNGD